MASLFDVFNELSLRSDCVVTHLKAAGQVNKQTNNPLFMSVLSGCDSDS
jgi:hypothetical protein